MKAVSFREAPNEDRFGDLNAGLRRWYWYAQASPTDHDIELRRLIEQGPPVSPQDADYVRARLGTETGRITFWNATTEVSWFNWIASEGRLNALTDTNDNDPNVVFWCRWCLTHFSGGEHPPLLRFLRGRPLTLHPRVAFELALHIWRLETFPPRPVLRQLIALLINPRCQDRCRTTAVA